jgi:hypothetical protein
MEPEREAAALFIRIRKGLYKLNIIAKGEAYGQVN